ncbi:craniofacial development protein 2-like [Clytia hemisphaerica]|uniref:craniofacial development protein 2-like n=1 Tax=Clytia hemisphaerica TaxID=252671 RepID=UPI0034D5A046
MYIRIMIEKSIIRFFSVYAPQTGLPEPEKDKFYNDLLAQTAIIPAEGFLIICGDLNGHVGKDTAGFDNVHGGNGFGDRNADGVRLLDFCLAADLSVTQTLSFPNQTRRKETWWWNETVDRAVKEKHRLWKCWKRGGQKEPYLAAKRRAKSEVFIAKKNASDERFRNLHDKDN